jgi:hypothetical protein
MRILFIGDIIGRPGRDVVNAQVPVLRESLRLDFVVANGENAAGGFGLTRAIANEFFASGVDCITTGNHWADQKEILTFIGDEDRILRPGNYPSGTPGRGVGLYQARNGQHVLVINVMGRAFMDPLDDPFAALEREIAACPLKTAADAIIVDMHAEASSEKQAMGFFLDGKVSLVVGTHTHVPTADYQVLGGGTGFMTDVGMTGDYDSCIGMAKEEPLSRFLRRIPGSKFEPAMGPATLCALALETDDATGLARRVAAVRLGGRLEQARPAFWE